MAAAAARDRDGNLLPAPYGGKGMGRVMFNAEGRMMAVTCDGHSCPPERSGPTAPIAATTPSMGRGS